MSRLFSALRTILVLGRVSNLPTVWTNVAAGWYLSGGSHRIELLWILFGVTLLYLAGMTLNDAFDARWDREHAPERPIPSGKISQAAVWTIGATQLVAGIGVVVLFSTMHLGFLLGLVAAILLYDGLHKKWRGSVLFMGTCRALVYLGSASAVVSQPAELEIPSMVWIIATCVVVYVAGLTLAARDERVREGGGTSFPVRLMLMLPILFPLIASSWIPAGLEKTALIMTGIVLIWSWLVMCRARLAQSIPRGIAGFIAGMALFDAAAVVFVDWRVAVACVGAFLLTLAWQRVIPAT